MSIRNAVSASSGNLNGISTVKNGSTVFLGQSWRKVAGLSALVSLTAATSTITLGTKWQVSNDNVTFYDVTNGTQNAAAVVFATGTAAIVTKVVEAPPSVYGYAYARIVVVVGVTTGAVGDLYSISYNYRQLSGAEGASA